MNTLDRSWKIDPADLKGIAIPREYGVWGLLAEAILVAWVLAPTAAGLWLGVAAIGLFFLTQPLKMALQDRRGGPPDARRRWLFLLLIFYAALAALATLAAFYLSQAPFWVPAGFGAVLFLIHWAADLKKQGREFFPEITGGFAIASVTPVILVAGGFSFRPAFIVWGLLCARTLASVTYVRNKVRAGRSQPFSGTQVAIIHGSCWLVLLSLAITHAVPWGMSLAFSVLCLHAGWGLIRYRAPVKVKTLGFQEMALGLFYSLFVIISYWN